MGYCQRLSAQPQQISMEEARNVAIIRVSNQTSLSKSQISITQVAYCENNGARGDCAPAGLYGRVRQ